MMPYSLVYIIQLPPSSALKTLKKEVAAGSSKNIAINLPDYMVSHHRRE
jgi:hypothetical protein